MDKLTHYITTLKEVIQEWGQASQSDPTIESLVVFDDEHGQYLLVSAGWTPKTREHAIIFHARLRDDKIWIEWDGTSPSMTEELIRRGVASEDLVLNWHDPDVQALVEGARGETIGMHR